MVRGTDGPNGLIAPRAVVYPDFSISSKTTMYAWFFSLI